MIGPLMQVNVGSPQAVLLGLLNFGLALVYFVCSITQVIETLKNQSNSAIVAIRITQTLFAPLLLFLCGLIIFFNGWRLDPILLLNNLLMQVLVIYLAALDLRRTIEQGDRRKAARL